MNCTVLFTGGKDSVFATYLAEKNGYRISCLTTLLSKNPFSYMFHTPSISKVEKQAENMDKPLILQGTLGEKEKELEDLKKAIQKAKQKYNIEGVITGSIESAYQASRVQKICNDLKLECFNPLWQKNQFELLYDLLENNFEVIITGVFAYPLNEKWLGKTIDEDFIKEMKILHEKYRINPAGEGGEYETFVLNCPLFKRKLQISSKQVVGRNNSFTMEVEIT